jgi:anionic cell wall polymer biosynthesis LytR-Cps2A-Psr (LCP) family protein
VSGKHGRAKPGRNSEPSSVASEGAHQGGAPVIEAPAAVVPTHAPTVVYLPMSPRTPPTPPELSPIRTAPLPEFASLVTPGAPQAVEAVVDAPPEPVVEPAPEPVVEAPPEPIVEYVAEPVVEAPPEPIVEYVAEPVVEAPPEPIVEYVAEPVVEAPPEPIVEYVAEPVVEAPPEPIIEHLVAPVVEPAPEPIIEHVAEPVVAPEPIVEHVVEAPAPAPVPAVVGEQILPSDSLGTRGALREVEIGRRRRQLLVVLAGVVVLGLLGWLIFGGGNSSSKKPAVAAAGRTQTTMLIQLSGNLSTAVDSALLAHDPATHDGAVVLVPSSVVAQVPGFGSMPFGQALSVGDPNAPRSALSDLMGITVDGSWSLTPKALAALVDGMGGITVTVDRDVTQTAANGQTTIVVPAGPAKLGGADAVDFATFEAPGETEQARLARFDTVFKQILAGLPKNQAELASMLQGLGSGSTASFAPARLATFLTGLAADNANSTMTDQLLPVTQLDTGSDLVAYTLDTAGTAKLVSSQLATSVPANRKITGNRVYVQNQVGTPGIGESTRTKLEAAGFVYLQGANTDDMPNATAASVVVIFGQTSAQINQGDAVARALGLPIADVKVSDQAFSVADIVVKLGADYKG